MSKVFVRIPPYNPARGYVVRRFAWRGMVFTHQWREIDKNLALLIIDKEQDTGAPLFELETDPAAVAPPKRPVKQNIALEKEKARKKREALLSGAIQSAGLFSPKVEEKPVEEAPAASEEVEPAPEEDPAEEAVIQKKDIKKPRKKDKKAEPKEEETPKKRRRRKLKAPPPVSSEE